MVKTGIKSFAIGDETKRSILVFVTCWPCEIQHYGLFWHHIKTYGFGYNKEETFTQRLQKFGSFCWRYEFSLEKLLQIQWRATWNQQISEINWGFLQWGIQKIGIGSIQRVKIRKMDEFNDFCILSNKNW